MTVSLLSSVLSLHSLLIKVTLDCPWSAWSGEGALAGDSLQGHLIVGAPP